jgi:SET domain-containing protein
LPRDEVRVEFADLKTLHPSIRKQIDMFCFVNHEEEYADVPCIGLNAMNISIYLNHSKTPNLAFDDQGELVALRNVKPGEELFIDYDLSFGDVHIF